MLIWPLLITLITTIPSFIWSALTDSYLSHSCLLQSVLYKCFKKVNQVISFSCLKASRGFSIHFGYNLNVPLWPQMSTWSVICPLPASLASILPPSSSLGLFQLPWTTFCSSILSRSCLPWPLCLLRYPPRSPCGFLPHSSRSHSNVTLYLKWHTPTTTI